MNFQHSRRIQIRRPMEEDIRQRLEARQFDEAFSMVFERFKDKVFRLAYSILRDEALAEDLAQEVFVKVWKHLPGYHGGASLSTWIYAISRNTCLTELKKRSARPTVSLHAPELADGIDRIPALRSADAESGLEMDIQTLLAQLPERYRRVMVLFYLEQKSYEEVAALLGLPVGTVKTFLFRAKKELLRLASRRPAPPAAAGSVCRDSARTKWPTTGPPPIPVYRECPVQPRSGL